MVLAEAVQHLIKLHNYLMSGYVHPDNVDFIHMEIEQLSNDLINAKQPSGMTTECSDSNKFLSTLILPQPVESFNNRTEGGIHHA